MTLKVSRLLDGDLSPEEAAAALDHMASEPNERDRFTIYGLIGDALRGNSTPDDGYSKRIFERIHREVRGE
jgi:negative regulator of sigma E activity